MSALIEKYVRGLEDNAAEGLLVMTGKRHDYAKDADPFLNFRLSAAIAGITPEQGMIFLMAIKLVRLSNLTRGGKAPANESTHDSTVDLANYANIMDNFLALREDLPALENAMTLDDPFLNDPASADAPAKEPDTLPAEAASQVLDVMQVSPAQRLAEFFRLK